MSTKTKDRWFQIYGEYVSPYYPEPKPLRPLVRAKNAKDALVKVVEKWGIDHNHGFVSKIQEYRAGASPKSFKSFEPSARDLDVAIRSAKRARATMFTRTK